MHACFTLFSCPFYSFSMQYVLQMETDVKKDEEGHPLLPVVHNPFVLEDAVKQFKVFVSDENMLDTKLVSPSFYFLLCCISFHSYLK